MSHLAKIRRPGFGPENTTVGRRGLRTRDKIIQNAARLFAERGFHGTSIDAIARAAGSSRATVYQYFESKQHILTELLDECEPALLDHARRLSGLGPDAPGLSALHAWLTELADLYDRYTVVFVEFPGIGLHQGVPVARAGTVSQVYQDAITAEIQRAEVAGLDVEDAASALLRIAHMVNLYRSRSMFGLGTAAATSASLAVAMQLMLFPDTPAEVLGDPSARATPLTSPSAPPVCRPTDDADKSPVSSVRLDIVAAASTLFAERGYHAVSMEDIAAAAEVSRASLYRHFGTKTAILSDLTEWAVTEGQDLSADLHHRALRGLDAAALQVWLSRYVHYHRTYGSVIRAWYDGTVAQQLPEDTVGQGLQPFHAAVSAVLAGVILPPGLQPEVAAAFVLAALGRLSEMAVSRHPDFSDYEAAGLMLTILRRALLRGTSAFDGVC